MTYCSAADRRSTDLDCSAADRCSADLNCSAADRRSADLDCSAADRRSADLDRSVRVKYLLVFQFPFLDRYSHSTFHFSVFSRYFMLNLIFVQSFN